MGTKFKEINTLSFIGHIGPKTERVRKEVDEEVDIVGCREKFDRPCQRSRREPRTVISATWRRSGSFSTPENQCAWPMNTSSAPNGPNSRSRELAGY